MDPQGLLPESVTHTLKIIPALFDQFHLTFLFLFPAAVSCQGIFLVLVHNLEHCVSLERTEGTSGDKFSEGL